MTSTITEPEAEPVVAPSVELTHVVCCDPEVALCEMNMHGFTWCSDREPVTCPMCAVLDAADMPCPKCPDYSPPELFR